MQERLKCNKCNFYDPYIGEASTGRCLLFDAVDHLKRRISYRNNHPETVNSKDLCRYDLFFGENKESLTEERIAEILNRNPRGLKGKITAKDVVMPFFV